MTLRDLRYIWNLALMSLPSVASGAPVPALDLAELVNRSDVVAVAIIEETAVAGSVPVDRSTPARAMRATLRAADILKGSRDLSLLTVRSVAPDRPTGRGTLERDDVRIFFLERNGTAYLPTSPHHPSIVGLAGVAVTGRTPLERVLEVLAAVLESDSTSAEHKQEAAFVLRGNDNPVAVRGLRAATGDSDPRVALRAAAALIAAGDTEALAMAMPALDSSTPSVTPEVLQSLRAAVSEGIRDPGAVPLLERLLRNGEAGTRHAAARALRFMRSPAAVRGLVAALDDLDADYDMRRS